MGCRTRYRVLGHFITDRSSRHDASHALILLTPVHESRFRFASRHTRGTRDGTYPSPPLHRIHAPSRHTHPRETAPDGSFATARTLPRASPCTRKCSRGIPLPAEDDLARCCAAGVCGAGQVVARNDLGVSLECAGWRQLRDDHVRLRPCE